MIKCMHHRIRLAIRSLSKPALPMPAMCNRINHAAGLNICNGRYTSTQFWFHGRAPRAAGHQCGRSGNVQRLHGYDDIERLTSTQLAHAGVAAAGGAMSVLRRPSVPWMMPGPMTFGVAGVGAGVGRVGAPRGCCCGARSPRSPLLMLMIRLRWLWQLQRVPP